jgi:hypothetical protein
MKLWCTGNTIISSPFQTVWMQRTSDCATEVYINRVCRQIVALAPLLATISQLAFRSEPLSNQLLGVPESMYIEAETSQIRLFLLCCPISVLSSIFWTQSCFIVRCQIHSDRIYIDVWLIVCVTLGRGFAGKGQ